jgi:hypothetical protein
MAAFGGSLAPQFTAKPWRAIFPGQDPMLPTRLLEGLQSRRGAPFVVCDGGCPIAFAGFDGRHALAINRPRLLLIGLSFRSPIAQYTCAPDPKR